MNAIIRNLSLSVALSTAFGTAQTENTCLPVAGVENFNVTEYAATPWYVQQQAVNTYTPIDQNRCVTAQYSIRDETDLHWWEKSWWGYTVDVYNYAKTEDGRSVGGNLCADYDEQIPSQLKVAPCFLPQFFGGPYWVVSYREGVDDGYALVSGGAPQFIVEGEVDCGPNSTEQCCKTGDGINRSGLWILTRKRNPSLDLVNEVRGVAKQLGFSTSGLFDVTHDDNCKVPGIDDYENFVDESNEVRFLRQDRMN